MQFNVTTLYCCLLLLCFWKKIEAVIHSSGNMKSFVKNYNQHSDFTVHKVSFTQKGYIQFLRYVNEVPSLTDYTFCIWVRSSNLTYSHPLLSYSKHEDERLIRVWISPFGIDINLEILQHHIFKIPIKFNENHWYHVCQSWSSQQALWSLYLNGKLKSSGYEPKLKGVIIEGDGDIVVGQEYTDFDKGLDDGIEGDVFGFNFVLSSTSVSTKYPTNSLRRVSYTKPIRYYKPNYFNYDKNYNHNYYKEEDIPSVLSYFSMSPNRQSRGFEILNNMLAYLSKFPPNHHLFHKSPPLGTNRILNDVNEYTPKPIGLKLVELSYNCALGNGAPLSGREVLISWTKSPVRVFGGAIIKHIIPFCT